MVVAREVHVKRIMNTDIGFQIDERLITEHRQFQECGLRDYIFDRGNLPADVDEQVVGVIKLSTSN